MKKIRIDKLLSDFQFGSRNEIKSLIKKKAVYVNNQIILTHDHKVTYDDVFTIEDKQYTFKEYYYYMLNKPKGYECSHKSSYPTIYDLIEKPYHKDLFSVGRLDLDTTGLLLLSNDGQCAQKITSKHNKSTKTYCVTLNEKIDDRIKRLQFPIELVPEGIVTAKSYEIINDFQVKLSITDGKYHQVKRMMHACGFEVVELKRLSIGRLELDSNLPEAKIRELTMDEMEKVFDD